MCDTYASRRRRRATLLGARGDRQVYPASNRQADRGRERIEFSRRRADQSSLHVVVAEGERRYWLHPAAAGRSVTTWFLEA